ncbi:transforming growth factor beta activator LRRC32-like [Synchiropus picturatus]
MAMLPNLLLLWSLSHVHHTSGQAGGDLMQSWNRQNLSAVPLDLDARLRRLDLSSNFIRQLHTLGLPFLKQLDLSCNQLELITERAFQNLAQLEELNLSRNALNNNLGSNSKALASVRRLRSLDLSLNGLSNDVMKKFLRNKHKLVQLKMTGNVLTRLTHDMFRESPQLRDIAIDGNLISVIDPGTFESLSQLEHLNLARNNLAHICDFKLHKLKYLNLSRNSLEFFLTHEDNRMYGLEVLDLSYNKLLYFPILPQINRLRYLYLQRNMIGALRSEASMVSDANSLHHEVVRKGDVVVRKNILHSIYRMMPLIHIDLSYNHFTSFPLETLSLPKSLQIVNFSYNCLQSITWDVRNYSGGHHHIDYPALKHLDLQSNSLTYISPIFLEKLSKLETLNLKDNLVTPCAATEHFQIDNRCVALWRLKSLARLSLQGNGIKVLQAKSFWNTSLLSLDLARNPNLRVENGGFGGVQNSLQSLTLRELNLNNSRLSFPCMPALTYLDLSNNSLNALPSNLICSRLRELDISNNHFRSLNHTLFRVLSVNLSLLHLSGNNLNCCDSKWLHEMNNSNINIPDIDDTKCFPTEIRLSEYLDGALTDCGLHTEVQGTDYGQMFVIVLFVITLVTGLTILTRKICGTRKSFIV